MLEQRKALYMSGRTIVTTKTILGSTRSKLPENYIKYIMQKYPNKDIFRVDVLQCLGNWFGNQFLTSRDLAYKLVSGDLDVVEDMWKCEYGKLVASYYRKYEKFSTFINIKKLDTDYSCKKAIISIREDIELNKNILRQSCNSQCKFLFEDKDYMYFAFERSLGLPKLGMEGHPSCIWLEHYHY